MRPDRLVGERKSRVVQVDIVELLANHQVGKEASIGGDKIGAEEGDFEFVAEAGIVGGPRTEVAGRGPEMQIPAVIVETCDVGSDLRAREGLGLLIVAVGGRGIDDGAALGRNADGIRRGAEVRLRRRREPIRRRPADQAADWPAPTRRRCLAG